MNNDEVVHAVQDAPMPRRDFLRKSILLALPAAFGGFVAPAAAAIAMSSPLPATLATPAFNPPSRIRGSAVRNVRDFGAVGNGSVDDTTAFRNAVASLPSDGGTVYVPVGNYKIDAERSVTLRSRMHFKMHPDARLVAKPTNSSNYAVIEVDQIEDVEISGGHVVGERYEHTGVSDGDGYKDGGGHCITIRGSKRVTIRGVKTSKAWMSGISVGCKPVWRAPLIMSRDVVLVGVVCTDHRRNALAITNCYDVKVYDSEFSGTHGVSPQAGIDIEPNEDIHGSNNYCEKVHIENCVLSDNGRAGIVLWRRGRNITIKKCVIHRNGSAGVFADSAKNVTLTQNTVSRNAANGFNILKGNQNYTINGNICHSNYTKLGVQEREPFDFVGLARKVERDIRVVQNGTSGINVGLNHYR